MQKMQRGENDTNSFSKYGITKFKQEFIDIAIIEAA